VVSDAAAMVAAAAITSYGARASSLSDQSRTHVMAGRMPANPTAKMAVFHFYQISQILLDNFAVPD
jgi:hypothetical protein